MSLCVATRSSCVMANTFVKRGPTKSLLVTVGVLGSPLGIMTKVFEARHCPPHNTKGLLQCSIDQGHGPLSGRSSGFQRQRVTAVWATQWPPGSGSQGDPCGAQSKGVTSSDGLPRFKMLSSANIASCSARSKETLKAFCCLFELKKLLIDMTEFLGC